ncbi:MAG: hypothetical protein N3A66_09570, partial [Planctomycetota bacterium]|nr:hypothetical protein [Planctomycetota bacterium]
PKTRAVIGLRDGQGNQTKRGYAYAALRCYSLFTYTDLVLTPLEKRVILTTTAVSRESGEEKRTASFKVELMTGEKGKVSPLYTLPVPAVTQNIEPLAWLRRGADGKPIWPEGAERPEILSLAEYYAKLEDLEPVPIGKRETIGKEEWDFSSGWALVDVRVCTVIKYRYRLDEDGKRVLLGKPQESQDTYAVICETKEKNPRYKRLPRNRPASAEAEDVMVEYEYIWEPALEKWIQEERRKRSPKKEEGVKKSEEAAPRERKQDKGEVSQSKE